MFGVSVGSQVRAVAEALAHKVEREPSVQATHSAAPQLITHALGKGAAVYLEGQAGVHVCERAATQTERRRRGPRGCVARAADLLCDLEGDEGHGDWADDCAGDGGRGKNSRQIWVVST